MSEPVTKEDVGCAYWALARAWDITDYRIVDFSLPWKVIEEEQPWV